MSPLQRPVVVGIQVELVGAVFLRSKGLVGCPINAEELCKGQAEALERNIIACCQAVNYLPITVFVEPGVTGALYAQGCGCRVSATHASSCSPAGSATDPF